MAGGLALNVGRVRVGMGGSRVGLPLEAGRPRVLVGIKEGSISQICYLSTIENRGVLREMWFLPPISAPDTYDSPLLVGFAVRV